MPNLPTLAKILFLTVLVDACSAVARADCYGALREPLARGGYTGELDCKLVEVTINKIGQVVAAGVPFEAYDVHYKTRSADGMAPHGGQRILFFDSVGIYLGQYSVSTPPFLDFRIEGGALLANVPSQAGNKINLTPLGPPATTFLNEEVVSFYK